MTQINNDITLLLWATQQDGTVKRQADSPADDLSRDRWLAALEDDAFGLPDGGLNKMRHLQSWLVFSLALHCA